MDLPTETMEKLVTLLTDEHGFVQYMMLIEELTEFQLTATVYEVEGWNADDNSAVDFDHCCHAYIKWDGCSHLNFGSPGEGGGRDGYLHLCGARCFKNITAMLKSLYVYASKNIKRFDSSEIWEEKKNV